MVAGCSVLALAASLWGPVPAAVAAAPAAVVTCQGETATVVGRSGGSVEGTPGDDVIVSNGAHEVAAGDGDDLICLTGSIRPVEESPEVFADAGAGDDRVTASVGRSDLVYVSLGTGADHYTGGRQMDVVAGGDLFAEDGDPQDGDADVIDTGTLGADHVVVGDGGPLVDDVSALSRRAHVEVHASGPGTGRLAGGVAATLTLVDDAVGADGLWTLDLAARTATITGAPVLSWTGFGHLVWAVHGSIDVRGTDGDDIVTGPVVSGTMNGGNDQVHVWSSQVDHGTHAARLEGGAGTDRVRFYSGLVDHYLEAPGGGVVPFTPGDVTVDVGRQVTRFEDGEVVGLAGFESYGAQTDGAATLLGTPQDDVLLGAACDLRIRGGAGDDRMHQMPDFASGGFTEPSCPGDDGGRLATLSGGSGDDSTSVNAARSTVTGGDGADVLNGGHGRDRILGGPGDDRLSGDDRADTLLGGEGVDVTHGDRGEDTCRAEYGSTCEQPLSATRLGPLPPGSRPGSVRLADPRRDVVHLDDPRHPGGGTTAPGVRTGDIVAVRTTYRHRVARFVTRLRSLATTGDVVLAIDVRYLGAGQFLYGDVRVDIPAEGSGLVAASFEGSRCPARLLVDRAQALVRVSIDRACLGRSPWVRAAVRTYATDDAADPSYAEVDEAPDQGGPDQRMGPRAWAPQA